MYAGGLRAASRSFSDDFTDGGSANEVPCNDEVIGMPLGRGVSFGEEKGGRRRRTMSSGSSGKRVMVPEPSLSMMFCLMRRILSSS